MALVFACAENAGHQLGGSRTMAIVAGIWLNACQGMGSQMAALERDARSTRFYSLVRDHSVLPPITILACSMNENRSSPESYMELSSFARFSLSMFDHDENTGEGDSQAKAPLLNEA